MAEVKQVKAGQPAQPSVPKLWWIYWTQLVSPPDNALPHNNTNPPIHCTLNDRPELR